MSSGKDNILSFRTPLNCLEEALEFQKENGLSAVIVIGLTDDEDGNVYISTSKGLPDSKAVYLLESTKILFCMPFVWGSIAGEEEEE